MKCPHCGQALGERICPSCRSEVLEESSFCHRCGVSLEAPAAAPPEEEDTDFSKRTLCSDGTCIGVIDERGICKVCGKPYTGATE
jgi:predicted amidophosphoribosyltransferase